MGKTKKEKDKQEQVDWDEMESVARMFNKAFKASGKILEVVEASRAAENRIKAILKEEENIVNVIECHKHEKDELDSLIRDRNFTAANLAKSLTAKQAELSVIEGIIETDHSARRANIEQELQEFMDNADDQMADKVVEHEAAIEKMDKELETKQKRIEEANAVLREIGVRAGEAAGK